MQENQRIPIEKQKLLYHLTSIENLESIIKYGLCSRKTLKERNVKIQKDVADPAILTKRGKLDDYVPFHFFCKNPFDGAVLSSHLNKDFCYIVIERDFAKKQSFKILPEHPLSDQQPKLYDYDIGFQKIDWKEMNKRDYNDSKCKKICMAEALSPISIEYKNFHSIVLKEEVQKIQNWCKEKNIKVYIQPSWFVNPNNKQ